MPLGSTECPNTLGSVLLFINPFMPTGAFNICCPRDCVSRHNGVTAGAPLKPIRDDSALRTLLSLGGLRGAPEVPPLCRETQSLGQQMLELSYEIATVGKKGLMSSLFQVAVERWRLRRNWLGAHCHIRTFEGHSEGVTCVQVIIIYTIYNSLLN